MTFSVTWEQEEFRRSIRRFCEERSPTSEVRRWMESERGYDEAVWARMAGQLGLPGLHVPERYGGQGSSVEELAIVFEEMGRVLLCAPYLASACLATYALLEAGTEGQRDRYLPRLVSGDSIGTLALGGIRGRPAGVVAVPDGQSWRLRGRASFVLDGHLADLVVVPAEHEDGQGGGADLFVVAGESPGLRRTPLPTMDQTRKQAHLEFTDVRAELLGRPTSGAEALSTVLAVAAVCLAAEMLGGAQRCLEMAVEYAKTRYQFGRAIGSFQAIKHKCADLFVDVESARAAVQQAAYTATHGGDVSTEASFVKAYCSEVYSRAAAENIQIHGGLGFTWEHDAHLHLKRAKSSALLLGDPIHHRRLLAERVGV